MWRKTWMTDPLRGHRVGTISAAVLGSLALAAPAVADDDTTSSATCVSSGGGQAVAVNIVVTQDGTTTTTAECGMDSDDAAAILDDFWSDIEDVPGEVLAGDPDA